MRVDTTLLAICMVDAWFLYEKYVGMIGKMSLWALFYGLADELIKKGYDLWTKHTICDSNRSAGDERSLFLHLSLGICTH